MIMIQTLQNTDLLNLRIIIEIKPLHYKQINKHPDSLLKFGIWYKSDPNSQKTHIN